MKHIKSHQAQFLVNTTQNNTMNINYKGMSIAFLMICSFYVTSFAQEGRVSQFVVNEIKAVMSKGENPGMEIFMAEAKPGNVEKAWASAMKKYKAKVSIDKKTGQTFTDNAMITEVSENTVDIYSSVTGDDKGAKITVFVDLGGGFISSADHPQAFAAMETQLRAFALSQVHAEIDNQIKAEEKIFSNLENELKTLIKNNESYHKEIEKNNQNIVTREKNIVDNQAAQVTKQHQIQIQGSVLSTTKDKKNSMGNVSPEAAKIVEKQVKTEEKNLSSYEKEFKNLQSDLEFYVKDIEKSRSIIAQREQDIIKNEQDQVTKKQQIDLQKQIIETVRQKKAAVY